MNSKITLRTGVWYGDRQIDLTIPASWDVKLLQPVTTTPLVTKDLIEILDSPTGSAPLSKLCQGKSRPLIIVDDLNRPTPTADIVPLLLMAMKSARIPLDSVKILMATGSHDQPDKNAILKKTGSEATACQLLVHDCFTNTAKIGVTSFGTPVFVNRAILESDIVVGVSGIYPNHTAGFGGGTKLSLGILGIQTIYYLHYRHKSAGWGNLVENLDFRQELDEIARMIGMVFNVSLLIDADRRVVKMYCGDPTKYFPQAVTDYLQMFRTQPPGDADVVISNTYPNDCSLTFARMKGFLPLNYCNPTSSRIAIGACSEGLGLHNIWPFVNVPRYHRLMHLYRMASVLPLKEILVKGYGFAGRALPSQARKRAKHQMQSAGDQNYAHRVWLYHPDLSNNVLPATLPGINHTSDWQKILEAVQAEQSAKDRIKALVYPCAFLQVLDG